jgi:two-component system OmpR family response regulator
MRILLVEDHQPLAEATRDALARAGFAVDLAADVAEAREYIELDAHDLMVLDLGLPDGCGLDLLVETRRSGATPVLVLTARDALEDRLAGLDGGADDYVLKPVEMSELVARCRAILRRPGNRLGAVLELGTLRLDTVARQAEVDGRPLLLGRRELGVLEQLLRRKGRVAPRRAIEDALYGLDDEVSPNAVDAAVSRLRRALEAAGAPVAMHTVRGVGWMLGGPGGPG